MTADQAVARETIRRAAARYTRAVDNRRYDELREVFLPGGSMAVHGGPRLEGVETIIAAFEEGARRRSAAASGNFQRHHLTTAMFDFSAADQAQVTHYVFVVTELGFDHSGLYHDRFVRLGAEWRIAERHARMEWVRPDSRFAAWLGAAGPAELV